MTFEQFHNALRILRSIDRHEIPLILNEHDWQDFRNKPHEWFIQAADNKARAVWTVIEARMGDTK
ncbi:MAG: hypothetical protein OEQ39_04430 [Gammaproteobacteria bacterium]|nr:hypothetical protein [Gammaproteobacteria bacterium]